MAIPWWTRYGITGHPEVQELLEKQEQKCRREARWSFWIGFWLGIAVARLVGGVTWW